MWNKEANVLGCRIPCTSPARASFWNVQPRPCSLIGRYWAVPYKLRSLAGGAQSSWASVGAVYCARGRNYVKTNSQLRLFFRSPLTWHMRGRRALERRLEKLQVIFATSLWKFVVLYKYSLTQVAVSLGALWPELVDWNLKQSADEVK